jgi:PAS domain S-box-containing protein
MPTSPRRPDPIVPIGVAGGISLAAGAIGFAGWQAPQMALLSALAGGSAACLAAWLLYGRRQAHEAAQQAARNAEARVSGIVGSAMDPIVAIDERQRIVLYNDAAEKTFHWPRGAVIGQPLDLLIPERFRAAHRGHIERFGQTGVTTRPMAAQTVLVGLRANGEEFPIEASISQHGESGHKVFTAILRDISLRLQAEDSLARSEARLRGILDSAMDAIITVDESQRIVLFNAAAEAVFGCPREEAQGAPLNWFIPERFRSGHAEHMRRFAQTGSSARRMGGLRIVTGLRRNGEEFPIDASISFLEEGGNKYYTVILRDVSERVRAEAALRRSAEELQEMAAAAHSVREQEKSRIARELHDELGQSLTALKMDVAWLRETLAEHDPAAIDKLDRMEAMVDGTVAATRRIAADLRPLMLDDLGLVPAVEWLVQGFTQRTGIACRLSVGSPEPQLHDPHATAIFRILQESLTNVARHSGALRVDVAIAVEDGHVRIRVEDDGVGFSTEAPGKQGSFGLIGIRERAHLLRGTARIHSAPGAGTRIEAELPL